MADEQEPQRPSGNSSVHDPLPYIVRVRLYTHEDAPPSVQEVRVNAYSLLEAVGQAMFEVTGASAVDEGKAKIEFIGPDVPEYWRRMLGNLHMHIDIMKRNMKKP